jgi:tripartite-type tricarboxylate transporter receptor subunit TctC
LRRNAVWFLACLLTFGLLAGCGGAAKNAGADPKTPTPVPTETAKAPEAKAPAAWKPANPVKVIVQYGAGGGVDLSIRAAATAVESALGQRVLVENKPGGGGVIGLTEALTAPADGYTLAALAPSYVTDQYMVKGVKYTHTSALPIAQINFEGNALVVRAKTPLAASADAFLKAAADNPGKLKIGVGGNWTAQDFARAALEQEAKVKFQRIPFNGGAPAVTALLAGDVDFVFSYPSEVLSYVNSGDLVIIAVAGRERDPRLPNIPTFKEKGIDVTFGAWRILAAPAGTPKEVVDGLAAAFKTALTSAETKAQFEKAGLTLNYLGPEDAAKVIAEDHTKYKDLIDKLGIKP